MKLYNLLSTFLILFLMLCSTTARADDEQKIFVIQSYHPTLSWTRQCDAGILDVLGDKDVRFFYLDSKRQDPEKISRKINMVYSDILQQSPDLVMLGDDTALRLLGTRLVKTQIPVVFFGINNNPRRYFPQIPGNLAGVIERTPVLPTARVIKSLLPNTRRILFLFDKSPTTESILAVTFKKNKVIRLGDLSLEFKVAFNWNDWKKTIERAGQYDAVIIPTFHALRGPDGRHVDVTQAINWTSANSPVPVFSCQEYTVRDTGTVGAFTLYGFYHGQSAAQIADKILHGTPPSAIPPQVDGHGRLYLNKKQLERFNINVPEKLAQNAIFQ